MSNWEDISTAPMDGTYILLWDDYEKRVVIAAQFYGYWCQRASNDSADDCRSPTHWMPLPTTPPEPSTPDTSAKPGWTLYGPGLGYPARRVFYRRTGDTLEMVISKSDAPDPKTEPHKVIDLNSEESRRIMKM